MPICGYVDVTMGRSVIMFAFLILAVMAGFAVSDDCIAESFSYDPVTDVLTVDSDVPDRTSGFGWDTYLDVCREIVVSEGVRSIGKEGFLGCSGTVSISLPSTLTHIGADAFSGCTSLARLHVCADGLSADEGAFRQAGTSGPGVKLSYSDDVRTVGRLFYGGERIASVDLGHAESISERALYGVGAVSLRIPDTVKYIGDLAFFGCTGMDVLELPGGLTHIGRDAFYGCSGLTEITFSCERCDDLDPKGSFGHTGNPAVKFSDGCKYVPSNIVAGMHPSSVTFSDTVESVGDDAFRDYSGPMLDIPDGLVHIGDRAFMGCSSLSSVVLSGTLVHLGADAFSNCRSLKDVTFSSPIADLESSDAPFRGRCADGMSVTVNGIPRIPSNLFLGCISLSSISFSDGVASIGDGAFAFCESLQNVYLGHVSDIGDDAFLGCKALTGVFFGPGRTVMGDDSFRGTSLSSVMFGDCTIGDRAFKDVPLDSVRFDGDVGIGHGAFSGMPDGFLMEFCDDTISLDPANFADGGSMTIRFLCDVVPSGILKGFKEVFEADILSSKIGDLAFEDCIGLCSVNLNDVAYIGAGAFKGCTSVTVLDVPESVEQIGDGSFSRMTGLTSLSISDIPLQTWSKVAPFAGSGAEGMIASIRGDIPPWTFSGSRVSSVILSDVAVIGQHAFSNSLLSDLESLEGVRIVGAGAFSNTSLTSVKLIDGVVYHDNVYADCRYLVHADLTSAYTIPDGMFSGCTALTDIRMGHDLETIGDNAFEGTALVSVQIPYSLSSIGRYAFHDCAQLEHVSILGHTISIGDRAFSGCPVTMAELQSGNILGNGVFDVSANGMFLIPDGDPGDLPYGSSVFSGEMSALSSVTYDLSDLGLGRIMLFPGTVPYPDLISGMPMMWKDADGDPADPSHAHAGTVLFAVSSMTSVSGGTDTGYDIPFEMMACIFALASALCMVLANFGKRSV